MVYIFLYYFTIIQRTLLLVAKAQENPRTPQRILDSLHLFIHYPESKMQSSITREPTQLYESYIPVTYRHHLESLLFIGVPRIVLTTDLTDQLHTGYIP